MLNDLISNTYDRLVVRLLQGYISFELGKKHAKHKSHLPFFTVIMLLLKRDSILNSKVNGEWFSTNYAVSCMENKT